MITFNQLKKKRLKKKNNYRYTRFLKNNPQLRGRVLKFYTSTPRKPNSAKRKVGKVLLSSGQIVLTKLVGSGNPPHKFATVLVAGGGYKDTPSVNYFMLRGALECLPLFYKNRKRSRFGAGKNK